MEYYSAIKRNKIEIFVVRWMDLESVIQSEVSQKEKNKYRMLTHIYGIPSFTLVWQPWPPCCFSTTPITLPLQASLFPLPAVFFHLSDSSVLSPSGLCSNVTQVGVPSQLYLKYLPPSLSNLLICFIFFTALTLHITFLSVYHLTLSNIYKGRESDQ